MTISAAKLNKTEVIKVYTQTAPIYDIWGRLTETRARQKALAFANIHNGESILEVAVGTGLTFLEILKANPKGENIGLDLTPAMLAKAQTRAARSGIHNFQLAIGDAYALDFPNHSFDLLMNNYMFDLLPEKDFIHVLAEFQRVLKPGGRMVLVNMAKAERWQHNFWETVYRTKPSLLGGCRGVQLVKPLKQQGFKQIQREYISQLGFPSEVILAKA